MKTQRTPEFLPFRAPIRREVLAHFDGGAISSDGGGLLLAEVERRTGILRQFAACFTDHRDPDLIEHGVAELIARRRNWRRRYCTSSITVPAATWRIGSKSSSCLCLAAAPVVRQCGRTSCGCGARRSGTPCWRSYAGWPRLPA